MVVWGMGGGGVGGWGVGGWWCGGWGQRGGGWRQRECGRCARRVWRAWWCSFGLGMRSQAGACGVGLRVAVVRATVRVYV